MEKLFNFNKLNEVQELVKLEVKRYQRKHRAASLGMAFADKVCEVQCGQLVNWRRLKWGYYDTLIIVSKRKLIT